MIRRRFTTPSRLNRNATRQWVRQRAAVAAVEFAVIAPIMMLFTFGLIEMGRLMMVKNQAVQATREGARFAVRPNAESDDVIAIVNTSLRSMAINQATIELEPEILTNAVPGSFVTVRVRIDPNDVSWVPDFMEDSIPDMVVETVMRRESTE
jgi:Flp pilus assembly protein TadG